MTQLLESLTHSLIPTIPPFGKQEHNPRESGEEGDGGWLEVGEYNTEREEVKREEEKEEAEERERQREEEAALEREKRRAVEVRIAIESVVLPSLFNTCIEAVGQKER